MSMLIDKNSTERHRAVLEAGAFDWYSFDFNIDASDNDSINMIYLLLTVLVCSDLGV